VGFSADYLAIAVGSAEIVTASVAENLEGCYKVSSTIEGAIFKVVKFSICLSSPPTVLLELKIASFYMMVKLLSSLRWICLLFLEDCLITCSIV